MLHDVAVADRKTPVCRCLRTFSTGIPLRVLYVNVFASMTRVAMAAVESLFPFIIVCWNAKLDSLWHLPTQVTACESSS